MAHAYLALRDLMLEAIGPDGDDLFLAIGCAVVEGHANHTPFTAARIARQTHIPKSTLSRRLDDYVAAGLLEVYNGHYYLAAKRARNQTTYIARAVRIFHEADKGLEETELGNGPDRP